MTDIELCKRMAALWIENGGDAEGIAWCWKKIQAEIVNQMNEEENEK